MVRLFSSRDSRQRASSRFFVLLVVFMAAPLFGQADTPATTIPARSADEFVGSMGINVHVEYPNLPYSDSGLVNASLTSLGMRHIRDEMNQADPAFGNTTFINEIQAIGKSNYTLCGVIEGGNDYPWPSGSAPLKADNVVPMITSLLPVIDAVEGPNEPDDNPPPFVYDGVCDPKAGESTACYPTGAIQEQEDLWHIVKHSQIAGSGEIENLSVLGMSEGGPQDFFTLVSASSSPFPQASYGNMHAYQNGLWADWNLKSVYIPDAQAWTGATKPLWTTEMGYHNYTKFLDDEEQQGVSERAAAIYLPIAFLSGFNSNVERTFSYELFDEVDDPQLDHKCDASPSGIKYCSGEGHYGLLNYDGSAKPAFTALQNLIEILREPGSKAFTPGRLDISFSNAPPKMGYSLLQKSNGDYYLAIWNDEQVYAPATSAKNPGHDIDRKSVPVTIRLCMVRSFTVYAPNDDSGANPTSAYTLATAPDSIEIDLPAKVLVIKIAGAS
jgi:hypothetical protein